MKWIKHGLKEKINICCILFFCNEWQDIKKQIPEYGSMHKITNNAGIILCPNCLEDA